MYVILYILSGIYFPRSCIVRYIFSTFVCFQVYIFHVRVFSSIYFTRSCVFRYIFSTFVCFQVYIFHVRVFSGIFFPRSCVFRYIFSTSRIPGEHIDRIQRYPGETHVVVIRSVKGLS